MTIHFWLTTIAHPHERLGERAAKLLLDLMQAKPLGEKECQIVIEPQLIVRESCKQRSITPTRKGVGDSLSNL